MPSFYSQDFANCGVDTDRACGVVSLVNALLMFGCGVIMPPIEIIKRITNPPLSETDGLDPEALRDLCAQHCRRHRLHVTLRHPCTAMELQRGDLVYFSSVLLKNQQIGIEEEDNSIDSHIVTVESIGTQGVTVINPYNRNAGRGFRKNVWGRMFVPWDRLDSIWQTTRHDLSRTRKAAVLIREQSTSE